MFSWPNERRFLAELNWKDWKCSEIYLYDLRVLFGAIQYTLPSIPTYKISNGNEIEFSVAIKNNQKKKGLEN